MLIDQQAFRLPKVRPCTAQKNHSCSMSANVTVHDEANEVILKLRLRPTPQLRSSGGLLVL